MISIIMPVYNVEKYLSRCIDSIIAQTCTDWELVIIDDGSSDNSPAICDKYSAEDSRILVFHKENGGVSSARNLGLSKIKGEYTVFFDSDDWIEPEMLERLLDAIERNNADISACDVYNVSESNGKVNEKIQSFKWGNIENESVLGNREAVYKIMYKSATLWNKMFRTEKLKGILFNTQMSFGEDTDFLFRVMKNTDRIVLIPYVGYNYVYNRAGNVQSEGVNSRTLEYLRNSKKLCNMMIESGFESLGVYRLYITVNKMLCKIPIKDINKKEYKKYYSAAEKSAKYPPLKDRIAFMKDKRFPLKTKVLYFMICVSPYMRVLYRKIVGKDESNIV